MKPYEWRDDYTAKKHDCQGIRNNEWSITVVPPTVVIQSQTTTLRVPMRQMERFARWYMGLE